VPADNLHQVIPLAVLLQGLMYIVPEELGEGARTSDVVITKTSTLLDAIALRPKQQTP